MTKGRLRAALLLALLPRRAVRTSPAGGTLSSVRFVLITALVAAFVPVTAGASTRVAHIVVASHSPVTVEGTGFHRSERVVVTVSSRSTRTMTVIATRRGVFRAVFKRYSFRYCQPYAVRAKGNRGSTALVKVMPECAPQGPTS
jgi:hypothetical protein